MLLLVFYSFLAGMVTILAPCVWPILPIVLSTSVTGTGRKKPLGIALGVILSFTILNLTISYLVMLLHFDPNLLRTFSVVVIILLGFVMLIPALTGWLEVLVAKVTTRLGGTNKTGDGFWYGLVTGITLGVIWTPCAGPVLATVTILAATNNINLGAVLITFFYALGVGIPLFLIAYGSQSLILKAKGLSKFTPIIQKVFGVIMILTALSIYFGLDQSFQVKLLSKFPGLGTSLNKFENNQALSTQLDVISGRHRLQPDNTNLFNASIPAPELTGITGWLNTDKPIKLSDLKGKVVLVDFWTYTCINCIRTLPFVTAWYNKYHDSGFVVIGVHTPEFEFEKETENVKEAIQKYEIRYPVAQDNNYSTWSAYSNRYWPAEYLIDSKGNIRRYHFGEGEYDKTEKAIQELLKEAGNSIEGDVLKMQQTAPTQKITPETYLGTERRNLNFDLSLDGDWKDNVEFIESGAESSISYKFTASKVYIILRPGEGNGNKVKVFLDDKEIPDSQAGADVKDGTLLVESDRLYNIIDLRQKTETHTLRLQFGTPGIKAFTFTFG